ncbi:damage-control phosphatase ARMT1 family protein [Holdemania massiliensis]|uniref:damage-control phosphatase ARMT1 family protein n=1 Tax=Holdemania massiliensis TaxID=1468449 RepID=UPI001F057D82|nr:ARMT1-like domain-containing protein [Holdemania massiliensis]MCH1942679.1 ARMT1-like domain-containing protein [Holdemania massiliensis]
MKIQDACLPCIVSQAVRCAEQICEPKRPAFYRAVFAKLAVMDFDQPAPAAIGDLYRFVKQATGTEDPYAGLRQTVNARLLAEIPALAQRIDQAADPFAEALWIDALANGFDFNPIHHPNFEQMLSDFHAPLTLAFTEDQTEALRQDCLQAKTLLMLGDNFGEVVVDKLLLEQIHQLNPKLNLIYAVRGAPVVNDVIEVDARQAGIGQFARILSNGDDALGTLLSRTSAEFQAVYDQADLLLCKGQANFECLVDVPEKNRYFIMKVKCTVLAELTKQPHGSLVCLHYPAKV